MNTRILGKHVINDTHDMFNLDGFRATLFFSTTAKGLLPDYDLRTQPLIKNLGEYSFWIIAQNTTYRNLASGYS